MRVVIQRVSEASVTVENKTVSSIGSGLLIFVGIESVDDESDIEWITSKITGLRIFADADEKMNRDICDIAGELLVISQFTLHASTKKGNRPSFLKAASPEIAEPLYRRFCETLDAKLGRPVGRGIFGADMKVSLVNDGPVTILIDSRARE